MGGLGANLREQAFLADSIFLNANPKQEQPPAWDMWTARSLTRCCRRGTLLAGMDLPGDQTQTLLAAGFESHRQPGARLWMARFNPRWEPKTARNPLATASLSARHCVVVGAGLAGASAAHALARRGWQVTVLDALDTPAGGASSLPVGLMAVHRSRDDSPRSRLSRSGVRLTLEQARQCLVRGQDWDLSGVMELRPGEPAQWHEQAAWIKPARLVERWLKTPGVTFQGGQCVAAISRRDADWVLSDKLGKTLATAPVVVFAAAMGCQPLLNQLGCSGLELKGIPGQMSWAMQRAADSVALPGHPLNGQGTFLPQTPMDGGLAWFAGATFETGDGHESAVLSCDDGGAFAALTARAAAGLAGVTAAGHQANFERLLSLHPPSAALLADQFKSGHVKSWRHVRCTTRDRLPLVGPLLAAELDKRVDPKNPTLWINTALGSRGLSLCVLAAELLAARLGGEPLPIPASLALCIDFRRK